MFDRVRRYRAGLAAVGAFAVTMSVVAAAGADITPIHPLQDNQTDAYGSGKLTGLTYFQNFDCVLEPFDDLDHNGKLADADPPEVNSPHCTTLHSPTIDPTGNPIKETEPLYVIVPFFETNPAVPPAAALQGLDSGTVAAIKRTFGGHVPDALKDPQPGHPENVAPVQCPEPGHGITQHVGAFGTCTMHTNVIDLGPTLHLLNPTDFPSATTRFPAPTPNHSHIIDGTSFGKIWWQVIVVGVTDPNIWPDENGHCKAAGASCLTSVSALQAAQAKGVAEATPNVPTNFFLFFNAREFGH
jgi:hypothetical protein